MGCEVWAISLSQQDIAIEAVPQIIQFPRKGARIASKEIDLFEYVCLDATATR